MGNLTVYGGSWDLEGVPTTPSPFEALVKPQYPCRHVTTAVVTKTTAASGITEPVVETVREPIAEIAQQFQHDSPNK